MIIDCKKKRRNRIELVVNCLLTAPALAFGGLLRPCPTVIGPSTRLAPYGSKPITLSELFNNHHQTHQLEDSTTTKVSRYSFYSQLSNKSTGTMEKNLQKSLAVLTFSCGTIGMNSWFLHAVLLFQRYYRVIFGIFKLEINRNEHYLLWKWYIKVSLIHINLMCMVEDWLHWS